MNHEIDVEVLCAEWRFGNQVRMGLSELLADGFEDLLGQCSRLGDKGFEYFADAYVVCRVSLLLDCFDLQDRRGVKPDGVPKRLDHVVGVAAIARGDLMA
jgi:hypothetical protein